MPILCKTALGLFARFKFSVNGSGASIPKALKLCKLIPAAHECSRCKTIDLYPRRMSANIIDFLERAIEKKPSPIQPIQTDDGLHLHLKNAMT